MADAVTHHVSPNGPPLVLPAAVELYREDVTSPSFTPRQLRAVKETYGRTFGEIAQASEFDLQIVIVAWLKLQEELGPFPAEAMDDVRIRVMANAAGEPLAAPDPFDDASSPSSPHSAATGE